MKNLIVEFDHWLQVALDCKDIFGSDWEKFFDDKVYVYEQIRDGKFTIYKEGDKVPRNKMLVTDFSYFPKV